MQGSPKRKAARLYPPHASAQERFRYMEPFAQFTTSYQWADRLLGVIPTY